MSVEEGVRRDIRDEFLFVFGRWAVGIFVVDDEESSELRIPTYTGDRK